MRPIKIAVSITLSMAALSLLIWVFAPKAGARALVAKPGSEDGVWETSSSVAPTSGRTTVAGSYSVLRLNKDALVQLLAHAPMEGRGDLRKSPAILSLPMPDGSFQRFHVEESPIMEPSLAARLPDVKTYRGRGIDDATATTRFDWTPQGFHALVLSSGDSIYIEPASKGDTTS